MAFYLSLGLHESIRTSKLQEKPSALKREHLALQNMKFLNLFSFLVIFALLHPADKKRIHADPKY
jgi:hypothetical protein